MMLSNGKKTCNYERMVLRDAAGETVAGLLPGAALEAARETLIGNGYIDRLTGRLTSKGKEELQ